MNEKEKLLKQYQSMMEKLQDELARDKAIADTLAEAHELLMDKLKSEGISFSKYIESQFKDVKKIVEKLDKANATDEPPKKRGRKPKAAVPTKKRRGRKKKAAAAPGIKIPAGRYKLPDNEQIYEIQSRGARPKEVKAVAISMGLDEFLAQCKLED